MDGDTAKGSSEGAGRGVTSSVAQLVLLAVVALGCLHGILYHLGAILEPFILSGFLVLALQPSVEGCYIYLAGLAPPHRWCVCGCRRRNAYALENVSPRFTVGHKEAPRAANLLGTLEAGLREETPLLTDTSEEDWMTTILEGLCRFAAVTLVMFVVFMVAVVTILLLMHGVLHTKEQWVHYSDGYWRLKEAQDKLIVQIATELHLNGQMKQRLIDGYNDMLAETQAAVWTLVNTVAAGFSEGIASAVLVMLYVLFWLWQPLPTGGRAGALVRSYIYKKTLVSFLYGLCVALLFVALGIDLAVFFGFVSFFLNYVPEVGAVISMALPIPVILLDGRVKNPVTVLIASLFGQALLKFIFSNVLEVKLIERDREMSIHPVWVIFGLSYFGFIWGPVGMLISVPLLALLKTSAMSAARLASPKQQAAAIRVADLFLACLEGRPRSPDDASQQS